MTYFMRTRLYFWMRYSIGLFHIVWPYQILTFWAFCWSILTGITITNGLRLASKFITSWVIIMWSPFLRNSIILFKKKKTESLWVSRSKKRLTTNYRSRSVIVPRTSTQRHQIWWSRSPVKQITDTMVSQFRQHNVILIYLSYL